MFSSEQNERLIRDVRTGRYSLLVGAGASYGGFNRDGIPLPLGGTYAAELADHKKVPTSTPLQRVFALLGEDERQTLVIDRFSGCTPSDALKALPSFVWKRVFSLNIDDALQAAYETPKRLQDQITRNYRDAYEDDPSLASVPIIHLHGWVGKAEDGFIFSRDEYLRQLHHHNPWMVVLAESLPVDPFIIMGTALDEFDLEYYMSMRTPTTARPDRGPSILVTTSDNAITRHDCAKYGLELFLGTSTDFMLALNRLVADRPTPIGLIPETSRALFPATLSAKDLATFATDFTRVPSAAEPNIDDPSFLLGRAPSWSDLVSQLDVAREQTSAIVTLVQNLLVAEKDRPSLVYLKDDPGGGKTTILRRLAFEFSRLSVPVLICSALGRIEPKFTASMIDLIDGPLVIIVDNFADQVHSIADTIQILEKTDLVFVAAERVYRDRYIMQALHGVSVTRRNGLRLVQRETDALFQNYSDAGFLGDRSAPRDIDRFSGALTSEPIAVACCRIMNDFRPLDGIIRSLLEQHNSTEKKRYLIAALAQFCINGGLRESILVSASGAIGLTNQLRSSHHLPLAVTEEVGGSRFIAPLNATIGQRALTIVATDNIELLLDVFIALANSIAPRVNRAAIRRRSPEARLAGRLFDFDEVAEKFLGPSARKFYAAVQERFKWNSRYWEQVALLHLAQFQAKQPSSEGWEQLDLAVRHARHAVVVERHPLTLTTLGKVLLAQMAAPEGSAPASFTDAFRELDDAIILEQRWLRSNAQPYVVLFRGTRDYLSMGLRLSSSQINKLNEHAKYARSTFSDDDDLMRLITDAEAASR
ncbi:SIR2 family protein [Sphingomonas jatrophae]|uniref:SIR2-like domain-containing protein n=1 Tax=Sphingomonas jatrophae TaxID=1166337 RepID=A0A1I6JRL0_9SPHN|nr:SIR2 family protein [Sphingomonas jatrophae]SFR81558.1 SIR2-like domain-containing protein [Sphingomonas jatrophae]